MYYYFFYKRSVMAVSAVNELAGRMLIRQDIRLFAGCVNFSYLCIPKKEQAGMA